MFECISSHHSFYYYNCTGDCDFCVKDDYHWIHLNPEMGTDLEYKFMCDYDFYVISYKGRLISFQSYQSKAILQSCSLVETPNLG